MVSAALQWVCGASLSQPVSSSVLWHLLALHPQLMSYLSCGCPRDVPLLTVPACGDVGSRDPEPGTFPGNSGRNDTELLVLCRLMPPPFNRLPRTFARLPCLTPWGQSWCDGPSTAPFWLQPALISAPAFSGLVARQSWLGQCCGSRMDRYTLGPWVTDALSQPSDWQS